MLRCTLNAPAAAALNSLENLSNHSLPVLLDLDDKYTGFIYWVMVESLRSAPVKGSIYRFDLTVWQIPCIGVTYIQTADMALHSRDYRASYKVFDPLVGSFNKAWSANRLEQTWEFYLDNDANAIQTAILEIWGSDNVSRLTLWGWKAAAWNEIGDWGGGVDAWNDGKNWTDDDMAAHNFQAQRGYRGQFLAGVGTVSMMMGCYNRVLIEIDNFTADATPASDLSTHYGGDQLLLKAKLYSTSREVLRPYPVVTYVTGGMGWPPA